MRQRVFHRKRRQTGFSILELMIALLITGIIATAAFQFYITMNQNVITQQEISEMQQICRCSLQEISKTVRMAGYLLKQVSPGHPAYEVIDDTLFVYVGWVEAGCTDDIDTTRYFLSEFSGAEYSDVPGLPAGMQIYKLMIQQDSDTAEVYADFVQSIMFTELGGEEMAITMNVQAARADETFFDNNGFRTFSNTERVSLRNVSM